MITKQDSDLCRRAKWWTDARFGMFIHWGLYSITAFEEWAMATSLIKIKHYEELAEKFDASAYEPRKWAKLAADAGMKYMVLTTKHHDGFCLFDTKYNDYNSVKTAAKRDLVAEYVAACREFGLKVGFYHSVLDWHHPNFPLHETNFKKLYDIDPELRHPDSDKYFKYFKGQVEELLTNYGKIDLIWFDGGDYFYTKSEVAGKQKSTPGWNEAEYVRKDVIDMIRGLQPDILVNNRLESGYEDFKTPEQTIPAEPLKDKNGNEVFWESCCTMSGNHWGYDRYEKIMRSPAELMGLIAGSAAAGGNCLLNIGPRGDGSIPKNVERILLKLGKWFKKYGESIYGTESSPIARHRNGAMTRRGNKIYLHILENPHDGRVAMPEFNGTVKSIKLLKGSSLKCESDYIILPPDAVSEIDTVIEIEYSEQPAAASKKKIQEHNDKPEYEVVRGKPIKVTGDINEADWCGARKVYISQDTNLDSQKEEFFPFARYNHSSCVFRAMHAGNLLYIGIEVESTPVADKKQSYENRQFILGCEKARILLAANTLRKQNEYNLEAFEITVNAEGEANMPTEHLCPGTVFRHAVKYTEKGYNVVIAVPFAMMLKDKNDPSSHLNAGDLFKCNLSILQSSPIPKWKAPAGEIAEKHWDAMSQPFFPPAHKVFWKGESSTEKPFTNVAVWALCKLLK